MSPDVKDLIDACKTVRLAAQQIFEENKLPYFPPFPHGWCGCVSRVLGAWLKYNFPDDVFYYTCGYYNNGSHAWIEYNGIILDITADQFDRCSEPIIVKAVETSTFHKDYVIENTHPCNINDVNYFEEGTIFRRVKEIAAYQRNYQTTN